MRITELTEFPQLDAGCANETVLAMDNLMLLLYTPFQNWPVDNFIERTVVVQFEHCTAHRFGGTNDEVLGGHPYYQFGLEAYAFQELFESDWIESLRQINSVHPHYNEARWKIKRHIVATFHDRLFECIANGYSISTYDGGINTTLKKLVADLK